MKIGPSWIELIEKRGVGGVGWPTHTAGLVLVRAMSEILRKIRGDAIEPWQACGQGTLAICAGCLPTSALGSSQLDSDRLSGRARFQRRGFITPASGAPRTGRSDKLTHTGRGWPAAAERKSAGIITQKAEKTCAPLGRFWDSGSSARRCQPQAGKALKQRCDASKKRQCSLADILNFWRTISVRDDQQNGKWARAQKKRRKREGAGNWICDKQPNISSQSDAWKSADIPCVVRVLPSTIKWRHYLRMLKPF